MRQLPCLDGSGRAGLAGLALLLAGCGGHYRPVADTPVRIGPPYQVRGVTYTPAAAPGYDVIGRASWYGEESGDRTANGERLRARAITAAHPTLPLPSYVEVTAIDSGRTILVRVNDRGPFARGRVIDLSRGAARLLALAPDAPVRVRVVEPAEADRARLRHGKAAGPQPDASSAALAGLRAAMARNPLPFRLCASGVPCREVDTSTSRQGGRVGGDTGSTPLP